jgi:hypothetical protein
MALINSQSIIEAGITPTLTDLSAGALTNTFSNSGKEFIYIENGSGGSITLTVTTVVTSVENPIYGDLTKSNTVVTIADGANAMAGTFAVSSYNGTDSAVSFTVSARTSVKVAILTIA